MPLSILLLLSFFSVSNSDIVFVELGATSCQSCAAGYYSDIQGLDACKQCLPGYYSNASESSLCLPCLAGTYADTFGSTFCTPCPAGTYSDMQAAPSISACLECTSLQSNHPMCAGMQGLECELFSLVLCFVCLSAGGPGRQLQFFTSQATICEALSAISS